VMHKSEPQPGPAGQWLIERLVTSSRDAEAHIVHQAATLTDSKRRRQAPRRVTGLRNK
jgi:hypothetical protein